MGDWILKNELKRAVLLSTGDELTSGKIADTNAQWLSDRFYTLGIEVAAVLTVGDFRERLVWAWEQAFELGDLVVSTGGIGPTADDLTTETVSGLLGEDLRFDEPTADRMRRMFEAMRRPMPALRLQLMPRHPGLPGLGPSCLLTSCLCSSRFAWMAHH